MCLLRHPSLDDVDQRVTLLRDLVFDLEDLLSLLPLLALQFTEFLLEFVLFI